MRCPTCSHRALLRLDLSALASPRTCTASRSYCDRRRQKGRNHEQALLCLARR